MAFNVSGVPDVRPDKPWSHLRFHFPKAGLTGLGRSDVARQRHESTSRINFMNYLSSSNLLLRITAPEAVNLC
jgi:hypothetical protein